MKLAWRLALAAAGLALFGWFVQRAGVAAIARSFQDLGAMAVVALLPYAVVYVFDTYGWRWSFGARAPLPFYSLLRVRTAGDAVNNIIPSGYVGGEAVKVYLLRKRGVSTSIGTVSVIVGKTCQSLAQIVFIALGALAAWAWLPAGSGAARAMFAVSGGALVVLVMAFWLQRRGLFRSLLALAKALGIRSRSLSAREPALRALDQRLASFYGCERRGFAWSTGAYLAGWLCDPLEILLVSHLLGVPLDYAQALAIEAFISVAKAAGSFIPGALGVQETGIVFLCQLFGLPPALGVSYAIFRRGRELLYTLIGGALLYAEEATFKQLARRVELDPDPPA